ncbi:MAG: hypothetical protein KatS3mg118_2943 [Paracoccaceae bacterium]|nr:MAG: hypothetical protein KatS3mg118_2943 [Paracoccaceae bacterium]
MRLAGRTRSSTRPLSRSSPEGASTATQTGAPAAPMLALARASRSASSGRPSPMPNSASNTTAWPPAPASPSGRMRPPASCQRRSAAAASGGRAPRGSSANSSTRAPSRTSSRAITKPSPPLFPGPHRTAADRPRHSGPNLARAASTTPRPACSISPAPVTRPPAIAACSMARIRAALMSSTQSQLTPAAPLLHVLPGKWAICRSSRQSGRIPPRPTAARSISVCNPCRDMLCAGRGVAAPRRRHRRGGRSG